MNTKELFKEINMKMTFTDHGDGLKNEKSEFVKEIAKLTVATEQTVYRWMSGEFVPSKIRQEAIAKYMGTTPDELWPSKEDKK